MRTSTSIFLTVSTLTVQQCDNHWRYIKSFVLQSVVCCFSHSQSHIFERVVPTGPITVLQLLIGLIQSRDNRGRHVLSSETTDVEGYENG